MIVRLHSQRLNQLQKEKESLPLIRRELDNYNERKAILAEKISRIPKEEQDDGWAVELRKALNDTEQEIKELKKSISEREQSSRVALYLMDADKLLNNYHCAKAEYTEQVRLLKEKLQSPSITPERAERIQCQLLSLQRHLCNLDNILSKQFLRTLWPEKKLVPLRGKLPIAKNLEGDSNLENRCPLCDSKMEVGKNLIRGCTGEGCGYSLSELFSGMEEDCSYERMMQMTSQRKFTYKRINHFRETLRQAQGKSNAFIPEKVRNALKADFQKSKIPASTITPQLIRKKLKKIKYSDFYEEAVSLALELNREFKPISITAEQEEKLTFMFLETEKAFEKIKNIVDKRRKNYLSYPSTARRLCELCGWTDFMDSFPLLKDEKLRMRQDEFWLRICQVLGWEFIPTVGDVSRKGYKGELRFIEEYEPPIKKAKTEEKKQANTTFELNGLELVDEESEEISKEQQDGTLDDENEDVGMRIIYCEDETSEGEEEDRFGLANFEE